MVVLSVAIVSSAKTLVARQYVEMTRIRVEGLLSAFPKLLDAGRNHTFIETETVRYVYQPMESTHLLLVTNKNSNILEDLETLRLLAKVVQDVCQLPVTEELVLKHAFDIVFAFDEVISFGYRESVTLAQIKTYTEMDSHEEKLHQMLEKSKMNEAREAAKIKQKELAKLRSSASKDGGGAMPGFGGGGGGASTAPGSQETMGGSFGGGGGASTASRPTPSLPPSAPTPSWSGSMGSIDDGGASTFKPTAPKKGMALGKKKPAADLMSSLGVPAEATPEAAAQQAEAPAAPVAFNPLLEPVKVVIDEKITAKLALEGGLNGDAEAQGQFQVTVLDAAKADLVCFKLCAQNQDFKYKVHPNLNKASYASNILEVREARCAFRPNQPAPLLKWMAKSSDESFLPVTLSCWPTPSSDGTQMVLELELTDDKAVLEDVHIRFPCAPNGKPQILSAQPGEASYDGQCIHWYIPVLDKNDANGTLEFNASCDTSALLPYTFDAKSRQTKCPMEILESFHQTSKDAIDFALEKSCTYSFTIDS